MGLSEVGWWIRTGNGPSTFDDLRWRITRLAQALRRSDFYKHYLKELRSTEEVLPQCIATTYHLLGSCFRTSDLPAL
jgi:hypothetical protein